MLEVIVEVDDRPLSRWGCDGVVAATPTGSTAYAFSAGGPVVWPEVEALLVVPISAHALFARPAGGRRRTSTHRRRGAARTRRAGSSGATGAGSSSCRPVRGSRSAATPSPVHLARLHAAPFTDRLVAKFDLPVEGWRASRRRGETPGPSR